MSRPTGEFWPAFQESVEKLNGFKRRGVLRHYQESILEHGSFEIISPFTGKSCPVAYSIKAGTRIAYAFECAERFWVLAEAFRYGHPLSIFVRESAAACQRIQGAAAPLAPAAVELILGRLREVKRRGEMSQSNAGALLLIGHQNFAHHLWNELSALDE